MLTSSMRHEYCMIDIEFNAYPAMVQKMGPKNTDVQSIRPAFLSPKKGSHMRTFFRSNLSSGSMMCALAATLALSAAASASAQTLHIGLAEDPDILDPTLARSMAGRFVF